jgi:hypothetical protein
MQKAAAQPRRPHTPTAASTSRSTQARVKRSRALERGLVDAALVALGRRAVPLDRPGNSGSAGAAQLTASSVSASLRR